MALLGPSNLMHGTLCGPGPHLSADDADALGYGIGVIVVNLLSTSILLDRLPVCGEILWVDLFALLNTVFCCIALMQSSINIWQPRRRPHPPNLFAC